jgi:hypothetical protein
MTPLPVPNHFDRTKPFYPLVAAYASTMFGLNYLAARGFLDLEHDARGTPSADEVFASIRSDVPDIDAGLRTLLGPLQLRSECSPDRVTVPPALLGREWAENHAAILPTLILAAGSILVPANSIVEVQIPRSQQGDPLLFFLRHARNAVAHNGRFHFEVRQRNPPPWRPAVWRKFTLSPSMHGSRLFKDDSGDGLLSPGDPIWLLWDIERAFPVLQV